MQMSVAPTKHPVDPENTRNVLSGPAPLSVTLLLPLNMRPVFKLYVPAFRNTTWSDGHDAIALLICAAVAPGLRVAQMVVRFGMPPDPARLQSMARDELRMPDHGWA